MTPAGPTYVRRVVAQQWYRIDKGDGSLLAVNGVAVLRAAQGAFKEPKHAIANGRFQTTWAIYSRGEQLTEAERTVPVRLGEQVQE